MNKQLSTSLPESLMRMPISNVNWVSRDDLDPNSYNPNRVQATELELLKTSILEDGWTQPIVVLPSELCGGSIPAANVAPQNGGGRFQIIDGYHRWLVSADDKIYRLTNGLVPTVQVKADPIHRQLSTIRHNRARGTHTVLKMAQIVREILESGMLPEELMKKLGMEKEEVVRLNNRAGMPQQQGTQADFTQAWVPKNST